MKFSAEAQHAQTLALLQEVCDYLCRLPAVPITRELCRRVEKHLADPENALVMRCQASAGLVFTGGSYAASGLPLLEAEVTIPTGLRLRGTKIRFREGEDQESTIRRLHGDEWLHLKLSQVDPPRSIPQE